MMKKLLMLMLVLGFASAASAGIIPGSMTLWVSTTGVQADYVEGVDSEVTLAPSDTLWIGVHNSVQGSVPAPPGSQQMGQFLLGIAQPPVGPANTTWTGLWQQYKKANGGPLVNGATDNEYYGVIDFGGGLILDTWALNLSEPSALTFNDVGVLDAKELHCDFGPSEDMIYLFDAGDMTLYDTLLIHQVPEPMTIVLLSLGGLLLRRRNK